MSQLFALISKVGHFHIRTSAVYVSIISSRRAVTSYNLCQLSGTSIVNDESQIAHVIGGSFHLRTFVLIHELDHITTNFNPFC